MNRNEVSILLRGMLVVLVVLGAVFSMTGAASAHPLGNFTINHFTRLGIGSQQIAVHYVVDMAEIPTFQELQIVDTDGDGPSKAELKAYLEQVMPQYGSGLKLAINDSTISLLLGTKRISLPPGVGGLPTMRLECDFTGAIPAQEAHTINRLHFEDTNYLHRLGWREVVVSPVTGVSVFNSSAYGNSVTDELKAYPQDLLTMPLNEREVELSFTQGDAPIDATPLRTREGRAVARRQDRLAELIAVPEITPLLALISLLVATGLGGLHALSPGHGKTLVGAYLVGSRATVQQAAFLGLTVTITHTIGVFALGLVTLLASQYFLPEQLFPILSLVSGGAIALLGIGLFIRRLQTVLLSSSSSHSHSHVCEHDHAHFLEGHSQDRLALVHFHDGHYHSHLPYESSGSTGIWNLLALGVSGGLLPCPSALVVFLSAVSLHRVGFGLLLVVAFSLGLAGMLTGIGMVFIYARRLIERWESSSRWIPVLSVFSALAIATVGALLCYGTLRDSIPNGLMPKLLSQYSSRGIN